MFGQLREHKVFISKKRNGINELLAYSKRPTDQLIILKPWTMNMPKDNFPAGKLVRFSFECEKG